MPFTKIDSGKNKGKYRSPSGRIMTLEQVQAYYASQNNKRNHKLAKVLMSILFIVVLAIANQQQWTWKDFDDYSSQDNTSFTYSNGWLTVERSSSSDPGSLYSKEFDPSEVYQPFHGLVGLDLTLDTLAITAGSADTMWYGQKDTVWFSLQRYYQGDWHTDIDTMQFFKQNDTDSLMSVFHLPAQHGNLWLWRNHPEDTTATNLDVFPAYKQRVLMNYDDSGDSTHFKTKSMWYSY